MSIDTLTADTSISRASPQVAKKNWETPIPNGIQENEVPDTGTVDMDFWDFVDIVNPLQHIPVVNTIYRELTGDTIKGVSRVIGGGLYRRRHRAGGGYRQRHHRGNHRQGPWRARAGDADRLRRRNTGPGGKHRHRGSDAPAAAPAAEAPPAPASPLPASAQPAPPPTPASATTAMAEPAAAGEILMPAAARRGPGATPAWRAGSAELPGAQAHGRASCPSRCRGRDRAGRQYRQDAGPARRRPTGVGAGKRETDRIAGSQPQGEARTLDRHRIRRPHGRRAVPPRFRRNWWPT